MVKNHSSTDSSTSSEVSQHKDLKDIDEQLNEIRKLLEEFLKEAQGGAVLAASIVGALEKTGKDMDEKLDDLSETSKDLDKIVVALALFFILLAFVILYFAQFKSPYAQDNYFIAIIFGVAFCLFIAAVLLY